jgi:hypothetical protein
MIWRPLDIKFPLQRRKRNAKGLHYGRRRNFNAGIPIRLAVARAVSDPFVDKPGVASERVRRLIDDQRVHVVERNLSARQHRLNPIGGIFGRVTPYRTSVPAYRCRCESACVYPHLARYPQDGS